MTRRLASVSVDLDEVGCYHRIHGLDAPDKGISHTIHRNALPRYKDLFCRRRIRATFFVVGRDAGSSPEAAALLASLAHEGHELANHSMSHPYDLVRLDRGAMADEVRRGAEALQSIAGVRPMGFRAPGYTVSPELFEILEAQEYLYDSSVFPCPLYFGAKAAIMGGMHIVGRPSRSILGSGRVLAAPIDPYRAGQTPWQAGSGMRELPIAVAGPLRLPFIGTSLLLSGDTVFNLLVNAMLSRPFVNLELHGIDLADADADGLPHLKPHQPDLRLGLEHKRMRLDRVLDRLAEAGFEFVTLAEAARILLP